MAKKIAIVTFRFLNFGTILQSLGLQEALHKIGIKDVEILDFPNEGGQSGRTALVETMKEQIRAYGLLVGVARSVKEVVFALRARRDTRKDHNEEKKQREGYYRRFENQYLKLSNPMTCSDLRNTSFVKALPYDCYIAGSDQIWNEKYTSALDVFFLKNMPANTLRMSYAGSFGRTFLEDAKKPLFTELIKNIDPILVREQGAKRIADELSGRESFVVPDPTLLHDKDFWLRYAEKPIDFSGKDYILVYSLNHDLSIYKEAMRLGKKTGKKVVGIKRHFCPPYYKEIEWLYTLGPQHFLWLVNSAAMVITNSFHAEVFSLILNTPCYPFLDKAEEVNERLTSLLDIVGHGHVVTYMDEGHIDPKSKKYDFCMINGKLKDFREKAYREQLVPILCGQNKQMGGGKFVRLTGKRSLSANNYYLAA